MIIERKTLGDTAQLQGLGLHSGVPVTVKIHPGADGIWFRCGSDRIKAIPENVSDTSRCTRLGPIGTIEHLMSALAALEITDVEVESDAPEMPAIDGSALPFLVALREAGCAVLGSSELALPYARLFHHVGDIRIAMGRGEGHWRYLFDAGTRWPGQQSYESTDILGIYADEVAPARTFGFMEDVPAMIQAGLAKGLDETTALILGIEGYKNDALFEDEPARHKLLDLIGDLYLAGIPIKYLNVTAERSGHKTNVEAAAILARAAAGA